MPSPLVRANLTTDELAALRDHSIATGISISRLVGDAVRAQVLTPKPQSGRKAGRSARA